MLWRNITICVLCVLIAAGLLFLAESRLDYINQQRYEMKLTSNTPLENAPPALAFATVAMGAFRGLVVDVLWMRADALKEKGQFFDAKQLADWITVLQPRFDSVWEFQAWNMAYNISVAVPASQPEERWRWVRNGYELIRDKGLVINPKSIKLYRQLAWIFQHKMGGVTDDAHQYYKLQLALAMRQLLGASPDRQFFEQLENAPRDIPSAMKDTAVAELISQLQKSDQSFADLESICSNYIAFRSNPSAFDPNSFRVIDQFRSRKDNAVEKLDIFARAYMLRNSWKLDPAIMIRCNNLYGPMIFGDVNDPNAHLPLNWQHPDAHAIYWVQKGLEIAGGNPESADELNADRIIMHGLQNLYRYGLTFIYDEPVEIEQKQFEGKAPQKIKTFRQAIFLRPDMRMYDSYNKVTLDVIQKYSTEKDTRLESIQNGHRNMLQNAVFTYYQAGKKDKALEIYNLLRKLYPEREEVQVSLIDFCIARLKEEIGSISIMEAREIVLNMLRESYFRYAVGDDEQAFGNEQMAREVYDRYQKEFATGQTETDRVGLPSFGMMRFMGLLDFAYDQSYPENLRNLVLNRIKVERPELYQEIEKQGEIFQQQVQKQQEQQPQEQQ